MTEIKLPPAYASLPVWAFGDSKATATQLCAFVMAGKKTANSSSLYSFEIEEAQLPEPGMRTVILDGASQPRCVIECLAVDIKRFDEIDENFARAEGEGDLSLAHWRKSREAFFTAEGFFAPDMLLVCERFRVVDVLGKK